LRGFDLAQLGHVGQQRGRKHRPDAFDLLQAFRFGGQPAVAVVGGGFHLDGEFRFPWS
jgi:hypothetical protein